jgi:hypothetical protein
VDGLTLVELRELGELSDGNLSRHLRDQYDFYRDNSVKVGHMGDIAGMR